MDKSRSTLHFSVFRMQIKQKTHMLYSKEYSRNSLKIQIHFRNSLITHSLTLG